MKKLIIILSALVAFSSCSSKPIEKKAVDNKETKSSTIKDDSKKSVELLDNAKIANIDPDELDRAKNGYGQGTIVDDQNRTIGALDFNERFEKYNASAIMDNSSGKKICLTFDQGYENGYTSVILDTLKEKNVKAVFFVLQDYAEKNPELIRRMIEEGHIVANHSVSHYSMPELSAEECEEEIMGCHNYIKKKFNYEMTLFRPPMGEYSEFSLYQTQKCGYKTLLWSYAYADWDVDNQPDYETAYEKLVNAAHPGAIYLLHSVSKTNSEVLPAFIDKLTSEGYEFTIDI